MSILIDNRHENHHPGFHRQERHVPLRAGHRLFRHQGRRRHLARQGWRDPSRPADLRHGRRSEGSHRRRRLRDLRAAAGRGRRHLRGHRRGNPADRLHHRGHSGRGHDQGEARAVGLQVASDRAELPGRDDRRRMQDRHHAGQYLQSGQCRHRLALGHADL